MLKKRLISTLVILSLSHSAFCGIEQEMNDMFASMGGQVNIQSPGGFRTQTVNGYTGGYVSARFPQQNLTPLSIALPRIEAGCGGIDAFGGSFSMINKQQFIDFTRNIGNNAVGLAFDLALQTLDPSIQKSIAELRDYVNKINSMNLSSCEAAKFAVGGAAGLIGGSMQKSCKENSVATNTSSDGADARNNCASTDRFVDSANRMKNEGWNSITGMNAPIDARAGDYMKEVLAKFNFDSESKRVIKSLTGTVVVKINGAAGSDGNKGVEVIAQDIPPSINSLKEYIGIDAGNAIPSSGLSTVNLKLMPLDCEPDPTSCLSSKIISTSVPSLSYRIATILSKFKTSIKNDTPMSTSDTDFMRSLIQGTELPLLKMAILDTSTSTAYTEKLHKLIVLQYASSMVERALSGAQEVLGRQMSRSKKEEMFVSVALENLRFTRTQIQYERDEAAGNLQTEVNYATYLQNFTSHWYASHPGMTNALEFERMNSSAF